MKQILTKEQYVTKRYPSLDKKSKLFSQLVDMQEFNPLFKHNVRVYDHLDEKARKNRLDKVAQDVRIQGGKVKEHYYGI